MQKLFAYSILTAASLFAASQPAFAQASGTITFDGRIVDSTCEVEVNGTSGNSTVVLPTVQASELDAPGRATGFTLVNFQLSGCTTAGGLTNVVPFFQPAATLTVNPALGTLLNIATASPASNVNVAIASDESGGGLVNVNGGAGAQGVAAKPLAANPNFRLFAGYLATGVATAGSVRAQVSYTLAYL